LGRADCPLRDELRAVLSALAWLSCWSLGGATARQIMTITYKLEPNDLRAFQRYGLKHLPNLRRIRYLFPVFLVGFSLWLTLSITDQDLGLSPGRHIGFRMVYFGFLSLILWALWRGLEFLITRMVQWRSYTSDKHKSTLCEHTVTLTDDAFVEVTPFNEGRNLWRGIYQVVDTKDYIYVFISLHSAHIIPKRAFPDAASARNFYERAVSLHSAAQRVAA
jgi:hypothetical protein